MSEKIGAEKRKLIEILREELPDHRSGNAVQHELGDIIIIGLPHSVQQQYPHGNGDPW